MRPWEVMKYVFAFCFIALVSFSYGGNPSFLENKGQWHPAVHFMAEVNGSHAYLDDGGLTMVVSETDFYDKLHDYVHGKDANNLGKKHAVKFRFAKMNLDHATAEKRKESTTSYNYFIGRDQSQWASDVRGYQTIIYKEVLPGIDMRYDLNRGTLKYAFTVQPGSNPSEILVEIEGAERLRIEDGALVIQTSVGAFSELPPFAFQRDAEGVIRTVPCHYRLRKNRVTYHFPEGYDSSLPLIIDPEIAFSSYIGAGTSNFGFTASYDNQGNLYAGAIVFGPSYPTTAGAFQENFAGGNIDCAITKFNADGTDLLYSTFLGGTDSEAPHSIVVSETGEAYIFGSTGSANFPITFGAYQSTFGGGGLTNTPVGFAYGNGSDMFISKINAAGNQLLGSTLIGGSGNDGISINTPFVYNYGDTFRGEIVIDEDGNPYVASASSSANFPIVGGYANTLNGTVNGVIFKMNNNLTQLLWSTYTGGNGNETAIGLQLASDNTVYFTGGTSGNNMATTGAFQGNNAGGIDGYVGHVSADGSTLLHYTYLGTSQFDQTYFVQLDTEGFVYVVGQSEGNYPVSAGIYSNPNSGQFIQKLSPELDTGIWSTVVGSGSGNVDISPSAFLVSNCGQIYIAGWGGSINSNTSSTSGLPVTPNAFQATTDGDDFYVMVLGPDAENLVYATYFGGSQSQEHVDGGTSRFDKNGTVYQAVCAGCGGNNDFPTQPGVWAQTNNSTNCNLGVFKFVLSSVQTAAMVDAPDIICPDAQVNFINLSTDADNFIWDFGDGNSSTATAPSHSYSAPGTYEVKLYASSDDGCLAPDSTTLSIEVLAPPELSVNDFPNTCPGEPLSLTAAGADTYLWSPATNLTDANVPNPTFVGEVSTSLTVTGSTACGTESITIDINIGSDAIEVSDNVAICPGQSTVLSASGANDYSWTPVLGLSDPSSASPTASPAATTTYTVTAGTDDGCDAVATVQVVVLPPPPTLAGAGTYVSCNGSPVGISISGANVYSWSPAEGLSSTNTGSTQAAPATTTTYTVTGSNSCGNATAEVVVLVNSINVSMKADEQVCYKEPFEVSAQGGLSYKWQPPEVFANPNAQATTASTPISQIIKVTGFDADGCSSTVEKLIVLYPRPIVTAGRDRVISFGDEVQIESNSAFPIVWQDHPDLSCLLCNFPLASPLETTTFYATVTSPDGCVERDSVTVTVRGNLYVPNAFTPDGDGLNDIFKASGIDIIEFNMKIWDRWGELIFESNHIDDGWNGGRMGSDYYCPAGVYIYRLVATETKGDLIEKEGHVTLIR